MYNQDYVKNYNRLALYLLEKGDKTFYNPVYFMSSCLYKVLYNNNFNLAYLLVKNGCNLYTDIQCFSESPLFYAMYIRGNRFDDVIIPEDQWEVIKLMLSKYSTMTFDEELFDKLKLYITHRYNVSSVEKE